MDECLVKEHTVHAALSNVPKFLQPKKLIFIVIFLFIILFLVYFLIILFNYLCI